MRTVIEADAHEWLFAHQGAVGPIITSPPDAAELGWDLLKWRPWFAKSLLICLLAADPYPVVFYVTDRRADGRLHSKAAMVHETARRYGHGVLWHKIALRRSVAATDVHRPTYSHMIAVGGPGCRPGRASPDVFPRGPVLYPNGMGADAARLAVAWVRDTYPEALTVVNPFCGRGTILAAANDAGLMAVGIDNDPDQCKAAAGATLGDM